MRSDFNRFYPDIDLMLYQTKVKLEDTEKSIDKIYSQFRYDDTVNITIINQLAKMKQVISDYIDIHYELTKHCEIISDSYISVHEIEDSSNRLKSLFQNDLLDIQDKFKFELEKLAELKDSH